MGVTGSGKSTVGGLLAARLGVPFVDADDLHSHESIAKMTRGEPLVDADRWPWLERVADEVASARERDGLVVACSALRASYRKAIRRGENDILFVHLAPSDELLALRLHARTGHFMPPSLLASQLAVVEELSVDEEGVTVDSAASAAEIADLVMDRLVR
ncbi:hypothetical protein ASG83_02150 [Yonghaparkia sp. Soil809]|nr:hypothetical protein ASG83_02150 [Yonghaparkia sp. Soil809]